VKAVTSDHHLGVGHDGTATWTIHELEDANRARVQALLEDGMSVRDIAEETGIPKSTVHRIKKAIAAEKTEASRA